jgi:hypothetical protein
MTKRRRKLAIGAGVAALSMLVLQQPAGAADTTAVKSGSIDFLAAGERPVHCEATVDAEHDTGNPDQPLLTWSIDSTPGSDCAGFFKITATYKDEGGTPRSVRYTTGESSFGGVDGAFSPTSVTLEIDYTACDPGLNDTCTLSVTASPK